MNRIERAIVLWALGYMAIYLPFFAFAGLALTSPAWTIPAKESLWRVMISLHLLALAQNVVAIVVTIRDIYRRPFPNENQKLTWLLLVIFIGLVFWPIDVFRYGLKHRRIDASAS